MEIVLTFLTISLGLLSTWSFAVSLDVFRFMAKVKKERENIRTSDIIMFTSLLSFSIISFFILFIHPGLIYNLPSVIVVAEILIGILLFHCTDKHLKDLSKFNNSHSLH